MANVDTSKISFNVYEAEDKSLYFEYQSLTFNGIETKGHGWIKMHPLNKNYYIDLQYGAIRRTAGWMVDAPNGATKKAHEAILQAAKTWVDNNPHVFEDKAKNDAVQTVKNLTNEITKLLNQVMNAQHQIDEKKKMYPDVDFGV